MSARANGPGNKTALKFLAPNGAALIPWRIHAAIPRQDPDSPRLQHEEPPSLASRRRRAQPLFAYKAAILRDNVDSPALVVGGVEDHVHALILLSRKYAIKNVVEEAKTETTKWVKKLGPEYADFHWQAGYGAFSVSESNADPVKRYITNQEEHHARATYQDEFRELCRRHGVAIDERYVWD